MVRLNQNNVKKKCFAYQELDVQGESLNLRDLKWDDRLAFVTGFFLSSQRPS